MTPESDITIGIRDRRGCPLRPTPIGLTAQTVRQKVGAVFFVVGHDFFRLRRAEVDHVEAAAWAADCSSIRSVKLGKTGMSRARPAAKEAAAQPTVMRSSGAGAASGPSAHCAASVLIGSTKSQRRRLNSVGPFSAITAFALCSASTVVSRLTFITLSIGPWNKSSMGELK
jgi:hypothetical protein